MKKIFLLIIASLVFIISVYIYTNNNKRVVNTEDEINSVMNSLTDSFNKYNQNFENSVSVDKNSYLIWLSNDGYNIFVPSTPGIELHVLVDSPYQKEEDEVIKSVELYNSIIKNELVSRGFKVNEFNSSKEMNFKSQGRFLQAYEKSDIRCLSSTSQWPSTNSENNKNYNTLIFSCSTDKKIQDTYSLQKPFFDVLEKETRDKREYFYFWGFEIGEETASTAVSNFQGGYVAFFYKSENGWRLISAGQAQPFCSELEERGVPKKYWNCLQ